MRKLCRTLTVCIFAAVLTAGTLTFADADARSISYDLNIPSEDLTAALQSFAIASHHKLLYKAELTAGKISRALKGHFTAQEAMEALLSGTGLSYEITGSSVVLIKDQRDGKTSDLREEGTPSSGAAPRSSGGQPILLAQVDQNKTTSDVPGDKSEEKSKKNKTEGLEEIVVTGTYIHDAAPITPITVITHDDLVNQGYTTLDQAFEQLPQNFKAGASPESNPNNATGKGASLNYSFASGVNLRGLGANATLVLLNGRRLAPTAYGGFPDISLIPVSIIERVEILTDGASALYGSDAVAGVVNIITRHDFSGVELGGRLDSISDGKTPNYGGNLLGGISWASGNIVANVDGEKDNPLFARNRSFTTTLLNTSILPENENSRFYASLQNQFNAGFNLTADVLLSHRRFDAELQYGLDPTAAFINSGTANQYSTSVQLDDKFSADWTATVTGQLSKESDRNSSTDVAGGVTGVVPLDFRISSIEGRIDGKIFDAPGGAARMALGAQYRRETLDYSQSSVPSAGGAPTLLYQARSSRRIASAYSEFLVPLVGQDNALRFVRQLRINVSARYDDYSDFGSTTNPKVGIEWIPLTGLSIHSTYSKSFQAPTLFESSKAYDLGYVIQAPDPKSPSGQSLALFLDGTNPALKPETATNFNVGFTYDAEFLPGMKFDASYFSVVFKNRISELASDGFRVFNSNVLTDEAQLGSFVERNPSPALVEQQLSAPGRQIYNYSGGAYTASDIQAIANIGWVNASSVTVRGIDLAAHYLSQPTYLGRFRADVDGTYFTTYQQRITPASAQASPLDTVYNPLRFRAKFNTGWQREGWGANARLNYSPAYQNSVNLDCAATNSCKIASWTTLDLSFSYTTNAREPAAGIRFGLNVTNVFNRAPPFVSSMSTLPGQSTYPYDPTNANAFLRVIGITVTKRWGGGNR